jgi:hypothetical protein
LHVVLEQSLLTYETPIIGAHTYVLDAQQAKYMEQRRRFKTSLSDMLLLNMFIMYLKILNAWIDKILNFQKFVSVRIILY